MILKPKDETHKEFQNSLCHQNSLENRSQYEYNNLLIILLDILESEYLHYRICFPPNILACFLLHVKKVRMFHTHIA